MITEEMIAAAHEKYGKERVKIISIPKDDDETEFLEVLAVVPSRTVIGEYEKWADRNPNKAKEVLINSCLLSSKEEVKADDAMFLSAVNAVGELIPIRKAIIKNS